MSASYAISSDFDQGEYSFFTPQGANVHTYSSQTLLLPFDSPVDFGSNPICTISKSGQVIKEITLKTVLGPLYSIPSNGYVFPTEISIYGIYDVTGNLLAQSVSSNRYVNTQTLNIWLNIFKPGFSVTFDGTYFNFSEPVSFLIFGTTSVPGVYRNDGDATFWGFDPSLYDYIYDNRFLVYQTLQSRLTVEQSGWSLGFTPTPRLLSYIDSVGQRMIKNASLLFGGQSIQSLNGNVLVTEDDIEVPLENQAALTILVGKNDYKTPITPRTYYTRLSFDTVPLQTLYNSTVQLQVNFDTFTNISKVPVTNGLTDPNAWKTLLNDNILLGAYSRAYTDEYFISCNGNFSFINIIDFSHFEWSGGATPYFVVLNNIIYATYPYAPILKKGNISDIVADHTTPSIQGYDFTLGIVTGTAFVISISVVGYYVLLSIFDNGGSGDLIWFSYDTRLPIDQPSSYQHSDRFKTFFPTVTDNDWNVLCNGYSNQVIVQSNIYTVNIELTPILNAVYDMHYTSINPDFQGVGGSGFIPVCDGKYFYTSYTGHPEENNYFYKIDKTNIQTHLFINRNGQATSFDGTYIYYTEEYDGGLTGNLLAYNTTLNFSEDSSWTIINLTQILGTNPAGYNFMYVYPDRRYNYLITHTGIFQFDPVIITPSIQSEVMVEYTNYNSSSMVHDALISQNEQNTFTLNANKASDTFSLTLKGPIKELWIESTTTLSRITFSINGYVLIDEDYASIFQIRPYRYHTTTPSISNVGVYSFALTPEQLEPTGVFNISRIASALITFYAQTPSTQNETITVYAKSYNVLHCENGIGGLKYL